MEAVGSIAHGRAVGGWAAPRVMLLQQGAGRGIPSPASSTGRMEGGSLLSHHHWFQGLSPLGYGTMAARHGVKESNRVLLTWKRLLIYR